MDENGYYRIVNKLYFSDHEQVQVGKQTIAV